VALNGGVTLNLPHTSAPWRPTKWIDYTRLGAGDAADLMRILKDGTDAKQKRFKRSVGP
jgi:hypothetical protein